jgi:hypothetical protein
VSRDDGFPVADVSVALYDDDKVKRLYRELGGDLGRMGHAMMLCEVTLLASWRDGRRLTVHQAAPLWLTVDDELVSTLVRVGLLDRAFRRPIRSWNAWFGPAFERREKRRRSGALGGRPPRNPPSEHKEPFANHPDINRKPRPTVRPSARPPGARAREAAPSNDGANNGRVGSLAETMAAMGLKVER